MLEPRLRTVWLANVTAGAAAAAVLTPRYARPRGADIPRPQRDSVLATDLEVVTVTDRSVIMTWTTRIRDRHGRLRPIETDTEVRITAADSRATPRPRYLDSRPTAYHYAEVGDLTDTGTREQSLAVRAHLDTWGDLVRDYFVCRGNHDQPHERDGQRLDHWGAVFHARQRLVEYYAGGLRLIGLDTTRLRGSGGTIVAPQLAHLRELLAADPDRPTLIFGHHPVTSYAAVSNPGGPGFVLDRANAAALHALYRDAPGVFLQHSGHTHRNRRGRPDLGIDVEFLEVAATKEYPGGYMLLRIYEGGYTVNFYKTRSESARRWSTRTRRQYLGLHPDHALGSCADRNHVVLRDFSGLCASRTTAAERELG